MKNILLISLFLLIACKPEFHDEERPFLPFSKMIMYQKNSIANTNGAYIFSAGNNSTTYFGQGDITTAQNNGGLRMPFDDGCIKSMSLEMSTGSFNGETVSIGFVGNNSIDYTYDSSQAVYGDYIVYNKTFYLERNEYFFPIVSFSTGLTQDLLFGFTVAQGNACN